MSRHDHIAVLVNSRYQDTPYDLWVDGTSLVLTLLVASDKAEDYARILPPHRVVTFEGYRHNGNVERAVLELHAEHPFAALVAKSEPDILRAARLRGLLGVPGQDWHSALAFRDKIEMKRRLGSAGIPVPAFTPLACGADLCAFVAEHGYPVVVKPVLGSGSLDTCVLHGPNDLAWRLATGIDNRFEAEVFVAGPMYIVDGLVTDGRVRFRVASRYVNDCLSFRHGEFLGIVLEPAGSPLYTRLVTFADRVLAALPLPVATTFHLEAWRTPDDELVFCEVASRTGGLRINDTLALVHGFDMDRAWFQAQVGLPVDAPTAAAANPDVPGAGNMAIYPGNGVLSALPTTPPPHGVVGQAVLGRVGEVHHGGYKSGDYLAAFVITGDNERHVEQRFHEVANWFRAGCLYRPPGVTS
jgi:hypothetical protein